MLDHLKDNKVDVEGTKAKFGPVLAVDPKTETFTNLAGDQKAKAAALLFREYRKRRPDTNRYT
jgi:hypothetical protein